MTIAVMRDVAQAATDALNANTFSVGVEASRHWRVEQDIDSAASAFLLTVIPASKQGTRGKRGGAVRHNVPVSFVLKRQRTATVNAVEADDEIADLMQEIEDFILTTELTTEAGYKANVSGEFSLEIDHGEREAGVMTLNLTVQYLLCR
jgi:hypothetical protein